jgi:hypothetical protein
MKTAPKMRRRSEEGIALLIAIFVLLLISVVAIALLVSSSTETALGANYRSSSTVYYAALAGLEEARGRLLPKNPNYFGASIISPSTTFPLGQTLYVLNRLPSEYIAPWDSTNIYFDHEYQSEFGIPAWSASWQSVNSVWDNNVQGIPGPIFKWVRINAATEQSLYIDVNYDGNIDPLTPIFYDAAHVDSHGNSMPSLIVSASPPSTAVQALEITALAYLPNGSQKILQYLVAPVTPSLTFPSALTMAGYSDSFAGPSQHLFQITGNSDSHDPACGGMAYPVPAIGVPDIPDVGNVTSGIPGSEIGNYTGWGASPSVNRVTLPINMQSVQNLNQVAQTIIQNADSVIAGPADQSNLPSAMSASNPMTIAIQGDPTQIHQGDFTLGSGFTGYGLLLVTGQLKYATGANWNGIVLVIGQGTVTSIESGAGGTFNGAMFVAQTRDLSGNPLTLGTPGNLGPATFNNTVSPNVGSGIFYNCSWIQAAQAPLTYKVLSFHEIPQ